MVELNGEEVDWSDEKDSGSEIKWGYCGSILVVKKRRKIRLVVV